MTPCMLHLVVWLRTIDLECKNMVREKRYRKCRLNSLQAVIHHCGVKGHLHLPV
jgi:hypothetical protein